MTTDDRQNFLTTLYKTDPDLATAVENLILDQWTAVAVEMGYGWQSIEVLSQVARDRELVLAQAEEDANENRKKFFAVTDPRTA